MDKVRDKEEFARIQARLHRFQEVAQAQQQLAVLSNVGLVAFPELFMLVAQRPPDRLYELDEYGRLEIRFSGRLLPGPLAYWQDEATLHVLLWNQVATLLLPKRAALGESSSRAGLAIPQTGTIHEPFLLHLVLAYLAIAHHVPSPAQLQLMRAVAEPAEGKIAPSGEQLLTREIRHLVQEEFAARGQETVPLPSGLWNTARGLVVTGEQAWQLRGEQAYFWGTYPSYSPVLFDTSQRQRIQLAALAGMVATPDIYARLPIPAAPGAAPEEIWLDYISLAGGSGTPDPLLRPAGLGAFGSSPLENNPDPRWLALSRTHGHALNGIAAAVLASASIRPPRYIGRVLELDVPHQLLPELRPWGIAGLVIQVEATGLYVSVRDDAGRSMAAAWWPARTDSAERTPLSYTPASFVLLHPVMASVWHDLKADAVVLEKPDLLIGGRGASSPSKPAKKRRGQAGRKKSSKIYLPPVRVVDKAQWGSSADRRTLQTATARGHGYRPLPVGWEEREQAARDQFQLGGSMPALLRRREEANRRAAEHNYPPPPPGFTYVQPFWTGGAKPLEEAAERGSIPSVRAKGLFSLVLGLQSHGIEPLQTEQELEGTQQ
jgi:hypothetical protein